MSDWKPINDPPSSIGNVLVTINDGNIIYTSEAIYYKDKYYLSQTDVTEFVKYWQPMPKPYKF